MNTSFTGGCVCGAGRYECTARPLVMFYCHCRDCQQVSGGPYTPVVYLPKSRFQITQGTLKYFGTPSTHGGHNKRGFCPECGSRLTGGETDRGIGVTASSLDDPALFKPQMHMWAADAQPWDLLDSALPKFDQYAPG